MKEIHQIFSESKVKKTIEQKEEIKLFLKNDLDNFQFSDDSDLNDADKSLIYYVTGYIAKSSMSTFMTKDSHVKTNF